MTDDSWSSHGFTDFRTRLSKRKLRKADDWLSRMSGERRSGADWPRARAAWRSVARCSADCDPPGSPWIPWTRHTNDLDDSGRRVDVFVAREVACQHSPIWLWREGASPRRNLSKRVNERRRNVDSPMTNLARRSNPLLLLEVRFVPSLLVCHSRRIGYFAKGSRFVHRASSTTLIDFDASPGWRRSFAEIALRRAESLLPRD